MNDKTDATKGDEIKAIKTQALPTTMRSACRSLSAINTFTWCLKPILEYPAGGTNSAEKCGLGAGGLGNHGSPWLPMAPHGCP